MARSPNPPPASDTEVRALLERYQCPVPFHAVRTRFLGNIASPDLLASPMKAVEALWGGELPVFDTMDQANELISALVTGLWQRLTRHQERSAPFRLTRAEVPPTREGVAAVTLTRREEIAGFRIGLFGANVSLDLPERAYQALGTLSEIRVMCDGFRGLAENRDEPMGPDDISGLLPRLRELTRIAEHEMHEAVLSCTRARRQALRSMPGRGAVRH